MEPVTSVWTDPAFGDVRFVTFSEKSDSYTNRVRTKWAADVEVYLALSVLKGRRGQVVDLGANIGTWSLPVALGSDANVLTVEALPDNVAALKRAIIENGLSHRFMVAPVAVMEHHGEVRMKGDSAFGTVTADGNIAARGVPLDYLIEDAGIDRVDVLKVDIEGCELAAFRGGAKTLTKTDTVIFEGNGAHCQEAGYLPQDLVAILEAQGFNVYLVHGRNLAPVTQSTFQPYGIINYFATRSSDIPDGFSVRPVDPRHADMAVRRAMTEMKPGYAKFMRVQAADNRIDIPEPLRALI